MNRRLLAYCLYGYCGLIAHFSCVAQENALGGHLNPPQPPFVSKLPDFARYEMTLERGTQGKVADPKAPAYVAKVEVTKTDDIKLISTIFSNGEARDIWSHKGFVLLEQPKPKAVIIYSIKTASLELPVGADDFFGLGWLSVSNYKGVVSFEGKKCYLFEGEGGENRRALVDTITKLPLMVSNGTTAWRYTYDPAPTTPLQFPPAFAKVWAETEKGLKALSGTSGPR